MRLRPLRLYLVLKFIFCLLLKTPKYSSIIAKLIMVRDHENPYFQHLTIIRNLWPIDWWLCCLCVSSLHPPAQSCKYSVKTFISFKESAKWPSVPSPELSVVSASNIPMVDQCSATHCSTQDTEYTEIIPDISHSLRTNLWLLIILSSAPVLYKNIFPISCRFLSRFVSPRKSPANIWVGAR